MKQDAAVALLLAAALLFAAGCGGGGGGGASDPGAGQPADTRTGDADPDRPQQSEQAESGGLLAGAGESDGPSEHVLVADTIQLPDSTLVDLLAGDQQGSLRSVIAGNPDTPPGVLAALAQSPTPVLGAPSQRI